MQNGRAIDAVVPVRDDDTDAREVGLRTRVRPLLPLPLVPRTEGALHVVPGVCEVLQPTTGLLIGNCQRIFAHDQHTTDDQEARADEGNADQNARACRPES